MRKKKKTTNKKGATTRFTKDDLKIQKEITKAADRSMKLLARNARLHGHKNLARMLLKK
jgi:hypothetical protein